MSKFIIGAAALLVASPVFAATTVGDEALDSVAGKANTFTSSVINTVAQSQNNDASSSIQVGYEQWFDTHNADVSDHKGANDISGATSNVQASVVESGNVLVWGSAGQNTINNTGDIGGSQTNMAYGVFAAGGF